MADYRVLNTLDMSRCPEALALFSGVATVDTLPWDYQAVSECISNYDAYLASTSVPVDAALVSRGRRLKVIGSPATGTDHLDLAAIRAAGIACFDIKNELDLLSGFSATSELAFTLLLALNRRLVEATMAVAAGDWARERFAGFQLLGKTLGILGLGRLGSISARIGRGFGMRVIAHDPHNVAVEGVEMVDFDTLLRESDAVTIHVHLNPETRHFIDQRAISMMKPNAILLNTSRGGLVDETVLLEALKGGRIAAAGLDMIDGEWMDNISEHPLICYARENHNLLITPHIGGATHESIYGARVFMARKVADYLRALT